MQPRPMFGRSVIYTDEREITAENISRVLADALSVHAHNEADIRYLYDYYRGNQPILQRVKEVRPEINNRIVENRANEIVSFKVGYLVGEPVQYVNRGENDAVNSAIMLLNSYMETENKSARDKELADWWHICGTSYRMVLPDATYEGQEDEAPFELYTLDPRDTFVVYLNDLGNPPVMGVKRVTKTDGTAIYSCYTKSRYFELEGTDRITAQADNALGEIPIVEYRGNNAMLGAFEIVLPQLDAINNIGSNRADGVEQFVQALMLFHNVDITEGDFAALKENGAIKFSDIDPQKKADIAYLTAELNQTQTQTLVDNLYESVLTICGMPNRNGGSSTSDTGSAVLLRDGWSDAEARAKNSEDMFKPAERQFLKLVLKICGTLGKMELKQADIDIRFTRRNYENIASKTSVLTTMLGSSDIHPLLAFTHCGLFSDPQVAYKMSMEYKKGQEAKFAEQQKPQTGTDAGGDSNDQRNTEPGETG